MDVALRDQRVKCFRGLKRDMINDLHILQLNTETNNSLMHAKDNLINYLNTQQGGGSSSTHLKNKIECAINHIYNTLGGEI
tara:strand:- start:5650 stop:5892 length:243 start_codon:yes stop_codon:yes gene_type:complete